LRVSSTMDWFGAAKPGRALPFQHANLDVVTPPWGHAIFRVQKKVSGHQMCRAWCLDARWGNRVIGKQVKSAAELSRIGIFVGQPLLAVRICAARTVRDSQERLPYQAASGVNKCAI
jgi:hypothetical protein